MSTVSGSIDGKLLTINVFAPEVGEIEGYNEAFLGLTPAWIYG